MLTWNRKHRCFDIKREKPIRNLPYRKESYQRKTFKGFWWAIAALVLFAFVALAHAGQWSAGYRQSVMIPDDDNFGHKGAFAESLNIGYLFNKYVALELETSYAGFKTIQNQEWVDVGNSRFSEWWTTLNLQLRYPLNNRLTVYGVYGFGGSLFFDKHLTSRKETLNATSSRAAKYGAGAEWKINKDWSLNTEASYHFSDTGSGSSIDSWGWVYSAGIKRYF